jgi:hypothetical protein
MATSTTPQPYTAGPSENSTTSEDANSGLPANNVLQNRIAHLLKRPVGRPPHEVRRVLRQVPYQAQSWSKPSRVVAKVEWHPGELYPRVGFIITNLARPAERVVAFYNQRGTAEQWINEGKNAIKWTPLSCRTFAANAVRLQLHALAYNLGNFMRTLAIPKTAEPWSLTSLREKLIKIGAKVVSHGRYVTFQMAEVAVPRQMFADILSLIAQLPGATGAVVTSAGPSALSNEGRAMPWYEQSGGFQGSASVTRRLGSPWLAATANCRCSIRSKARSSLETAGIWRMSGYCRWRGMMTRRRR